MLDPRYAQPTNHGRWNAAPEEIRTPNLLIRSAPQQVADDRADQKPKPANQDDRCGSREVVAIEQDKTSEHRGHRRHQGRDEDGFTVASTNSCRRLAKPRE